VHAARNLADAFCCPRCAGTLAPADDGLRCTRCATQFPRFGSIPCLVDDPALWRALWLSRLESYSTGGELRARNLREEADGPGELLARTRKRLTRVAAAFEAHIAGIDALFEPLQAGADLLPAMAIPARPDPGGEVAILECYEHLFRDWIWGARECALTFDLIKPALPAGIERIAIYGAGAARLAVDVHQSAAPAATFALDVNPLPFFVVDRMLAGETVTLPELPVDPTSEDEVAIERQLALPFAVRDGFSLVFADSLRPPFAAGSLDVVVTSWFIDVARADLRQTAASINRVLRPGGLWVNLGPLRFHAVLARAYTIEEVLEIVAGSAFDVASHGRHDLPYFDSPVSGSHRTDAVLTFTARKSGEAPAVDIPDAVPRWVANPLEPIPITPALVSLGKTSMFTTSVLSMIDGTRSIVDVARALGGAWGVDPARVQDELRAFLAKLPGA